MARSHLATKKSRQQPVRYQNVLFGAEVKLIAFSLEVRLLEVNMT